MLAATTIVATSAAPSAGSSNGELADVRAATAPFHNADTATAAGYEPTDECVAVPGLGVMGEHWVNPSNFTADPTTLDPRRPQALLYVPGQGGPQLVAVEYIVFAPGADPVSDTNVDPNGPQRFGQHFHGPMAGHTSGMPTHYDLHVWMWRHNPNGTFAQFNPSPGLSC